MRGHHALLERDDRVVGDVDIFRADLSAALGDVAVAEPVLRADEIDAFVCVERMHLERRESDEHPRAGEASLVVLVVADDVAHVLAEEAFDALVKFLHALDVFLVHPALAVRILRLRLERRDGLRLLIVERDVGHEVLDHREALHRRHGDLLARCELVHARHAHELGVAVHLGAARDRKSTRLNSSHRTISYAVFCLKKKKNKTKHSTTACRSTDKRPKYLYRNDRAATTGRRE